MEQVFENGSDHDTRDILIKIDAELICFYFNEQYRLRQNWINEEREKRIESGEEDLTDDEQSNHEFYWIPIDQWKSDRKDTRQGRGDNWHYHMNKKSWFSSEMYEYIEKNV